MMNNPLKIRSIGRSDPTSPVAELEISIASRVENGRPMVDRLISFMKPLFHVYSDDSAFELDIAIHEAVANAIKHGNDQDFDKRVYVRCRYNMAGEVWISVSDEGHGFDHTAITDPTEPANLFLDHGRGIHMMRAFMDEVVFENRGSVVCMRKQLKPRQPEAGCSQDAFRLGCR